MGRQALPIGRGRLRPPSPINKPARVAGADGYADRRHEVVELAVELCWRWRKRACPSTHGPSAAPPTGRNTKTWELWKMPQRHAVPQLHA